MDDEWIIGNLAAAERLGIPPSTWRGYVTRDKERLPAKQRIQPAKRIIRGAHAVPCWRASTLDAWQRSRPGRGNWRPQPAEPPAEAAAAEPAPDTSTCPTCGTLLDPDGSCFACR